jgi:cytochrome P450
LFPQNIKKKYPLVLARVNQLVDRIEAQGAAASIDVDQAALRVTLDVIGLVSNCITALGLGLLSL